MLEFFKSRKGLITCSFNNNLLHSSYDPLKEAEKYVKLKLQETDTEPSVIIILYPGLNYIYDCLIKKYPETKYIILHASKQMFENNISKYSNNNVYAWHPEINEINKKDLYSYLKSVIDEIDLKGLLLFDWTPVFKSFPDSSEFISNCVSRVIREYNGNINTTNYFGKRYFSNIIKNALSLDKTIVYKDTGKPVFITSSGPTLEKSADLIKNNRDKIFLLALSSSLSFLIENNIEPDLLLTTDPGFYSTYHLRKKSQGNFTTAAPLTSYHLENCNKPLFLLNQNTLQEKFFLSNFPLKYSDIQQNGTVSGSALHLALSISSYPVFFAGLDFCSSDIKSHCMPNEFSSSEISFSSRTNPHLGMMYNKYTEHYTYDTDKGNRTSIQLKTYSSWFDSIIPGRKIYRINSSDIDIRSFENINIIEAGGIINNQAISDPVTEETSADKESVRKSVIDSLENLNKDIISKKNKNLDDSYFRSFYFDILYNYSASVYLDIYGDFKSGNKDTALKKYRDLNDECISFFEFLKTKTENYE